MGWYEVWRRYHRVDSEWGNRVLYDGRGMMSRISKEGGSTPSSAADDQMILPSGTSIKLFVVEEAMMVLVLLGLRALLKQGEEEIEKSSAVPVVVARM